MSIMYFPISIKSENLFEQLLDILHLKNKEQNLLLPLILKNRCGFLFINNFSFVARDNFFTRTDYVD